MATHGTKRKTTDIPAEEQSPSPTKRNKQLEDAEDHKEPVFHVCRVVHTRTAATRIDRNSLVVSFEEATHRYRLKFDGGEIEKQLHHRVPVKSVTEFISSYFTPFDAVSSAMSVFCSGSFDRKRNDKSDLLFGCNSVADIIKRWDENAKAAAHKGHCMHAAIASFIAIEFPNEDHGPVHYKLIQPKVNKEQREEGRQLSEYKSFVERHQRLLSKLARKAGIGDLDRLTLIPEVPCGSMDHMLCGTPDLVMVNTKDECIIVDWKSGKSALKKDAYGKGKRVCDHLPASKLTQTELQLALYSALVRRCHQFTCKGMFVVLFHPKPESPETTYSPYDIHEVPRVRMMDAAAMLYEREQEVIAVRGGGRRGGKKRSMFYFAISFHNPSSPLGSINTALDLGAPETRGRPAV